MLEVLTGRRNVEINLTLAEWDILKDLIHMAERGERRLGVPLEIHNGDQKIEITSSEVKILLTT